MTALCDRNTAHSQKKKKNQNKYIIKRKNVREAIIIYIQS